MKEFGESPVVNRDDKESQIFSERILFENRAAATSVSDEAAARRIVSDEKFACSCLPELIFTGVAAGSYGYFLGGLRQIHRQFLRDRAKREKEEETGVD
jgi:hypothetical protein